MFEILRPFIISFLIGLFIGIERERSHPKGEQAMGVRTFVLLALLGTLAAHIHEVEFTIPISLFVLSAILLSYFRTSGKSQGDVGITTEFSAGVVYCLGYIAPRDPLLTAVLGSAVLIILLARKHLHTFSRDQLKPEEIQASVTLIVINLIILPFLPDRTIDPWHLFNPRMLGLFIAILAGIQFGGYVAIRVFGQRLGMILMGFIGGLVSSTAVFAALPRVVRDDPALIRPAVVAALLATVGSLAEALIIIAVVSVSLANEVLVPMLAMLIIGMLVAYIIARGDDGKMVVPQQNNPLDLKGLLKISTFIGTMLIAVTIADRYAGTNGVQIVSFLGGLFQLQSTSLATAVLFSQNKIVLHIASISVIAAVLASYLSKFILLWALDHKRFAVITSLGLLAMLGVGVLVFWLA